MSWEQTAQGIRESVKRYQERVGNSPVEACYYWRAGVNDDSLASQEKALANILRDLNHILRLLDTADQKMREGDVSWAMNCAYYAGFMMTQISMSVGRSWAWRTGMKARFSRSRLVAACREGTKRNHGTPPDDEIVLSVRTYIADGALRTAAIQATAIALNIHRSTVYRVLKRAEK